MTFMGVGLRIDDKIAFFSQNHAAILRSQYQNRSFARYEK